MFHFRTLPAKGVTVRQNRPRSLLRAVIAVCSACLVTVIALASPAAADNDQQNSAWYFNDDPRLEGPAEGWTRRTSGGFGNDYHDTYGIGNSSQRDNYAVWDMGHRHGWQSVWVWVPEAPADVRATVSYRVYRNESLLATKVIDQAKQKRWQMLGFWSFKGADVRIEVWDNETSEHIDPQRIASSRIGIDVVAMKCFWSCDDTSRENIEHEIQHTGNSNDGNLSRFYEGLYQQYREQSPIGHRCNTDTGDANLADAWYSTSRTVTHRCYDVRVGRLRVGSSVKYHFPLGECTSWVQFRVRGTNVLSEFDNGFLHECFGGRGAAWGDAAKWDDNAHRAGVRYGNTPKRHAVAQWNWAPRGHVAFVESVSADGRTIWVSEMNFAGDSVCSLGVRRISKDAPGSGVYRWPDRFIHFG